MFGDISISGSLFVICQAKMLIAKKNSELGRNPN
jgi:hypothetical protein